MENLENLDELTCCDIRTAEIVVMIKAAQYSELIEGFNLQGLLKKLGVRYAKKEKVH